MTSGPSGQVSPSATITLGLAESAMPLLKFSHRTIAVLIGKEMNSIPMFGSSISALTAAGSDVRRKPGGDVERIAVVAVCAAALRRPSSAWPARAREARGRSPRRNRWSSPTIRARGGENAGPLRRRLRDSAPGFRTRSIISSMVVTTIAPASSTCVRMVA